jgi:1,4-dihydroxy-2-naphthoate octaprenyltransferase
MPNFYKDNLHVIASTSINFIIRNLDNDYFDYIIGKDEDLLKLDPHSS